MQRVVAKIKMSKPWRARKRIACHGKHSCLNKTIKGITFVIHFFVVMIVLFLGAIVLALLEDSEVFHTNQNNSSVEKSHVFSKSTKHEEQPTNDQDKFWKSMQKKYNFTIDQKVQDALWLDIDFNIRKLHRSNDPGQDHHHMDTISGTQERDKRFIIMKWFYFVIVASTTIGYGHVYPMTDEGKLFYIFFSILGIVLMMTLLRSCGKILMLANKKVYTVMRRVVFGNRKYVSDQLMSVVTIIVMFLIFMATVVLHDKSINEVKDWSMVDTFYFWLVTFTTVGFGDVHFPLKVEIEHFAELVLYRVFGLSFLAAIIESIHSYIKYRRLIIIEKSKPRLRKVARVMSSSRLQRGSDMDRMIGSVV